MENEINEVKNDKEYLIEVIKILEIIAFKFPFQHEPILKFIIESIISDDKAISHNWSLIDQGLTMLKNKQSFLHESDQTEIAKAIHSRILALKHTD